MSTLRRKPASTKDDIYETNPELDYSRSPVTVAKPEDSTFFDNRTVIDKVSLLIIKSENEQLLDSEIDRSKPSNAQVYQPPNLISETESPIEKAIFKIEIEDHNLIKEENDAPVAEGQECRVAARHFLYNLVTFVNSLCDICDKINLCRVIKLNKQEQSLAAQVLKKVVKLGLSRRKVFLYKGPKRACRQCFTKLIHLRSYLREKIINQQLKAAKQMDPTNSHDKSCLCQTCQNSYSGLDVLINVIEQQQNDSQNTYSSSNTYIDDHHFQALEARSLEYGHNNIELQNATSQDQLHSNNNQNSSFLYHDNNLPSVMQTQSMFPVSNPYTYYPEPTQYMPSTSTANYFMDNVSFPDQNQKRPHSSDSSSSCTSDTVLPIMLSHMSDPECQPSTSTSPSSKSRKGKKICQWCHKVFNHTGDYTKHVRTHTKEKPYPCPQCGKTFPHTSNLHRHVKTHSDQRPHKCEFCGKEFIRKDKLKCHKECCSRRRKSE